MTVGVGVTEWTRLAVGVGIAVNDSVGEEMLSTDELSPDTDIGAEAAIIETL